MPITHEPGLTESLVETAASAPPPQVTRANPTNPGVPRALAWTTSLRVLTRALAIITTLAVARLVPPEEYGTFAVILIAHQGLNAITDVSLNAAIVQTRGDPRRYLDTVWTVGIVRGVILFAIVLVAAPWWCGLFDVPQATDLLRVLAVVQLVGGFQNPAVDLLRRELRFDRVFLLYAAEAITYSVVAIAIAAATRNAWALVIAAVLGFAARVVASYLITTVRARLGFDRGLFTEMFRFTRWTNAYAIVEFLLDTADNTIVARTVNTLALGFYRMGYQLATEGSNGIQWVVTSVAFPAFARIQFDPEHVRASFRGLLGFVSATLAPFTVLLAIVAPSAIPLLLGERWTPAVEPLRVLAFAALIRGVLETARPVLLGTGRSREDFWLKVAQAALLLALAIPGGILFGMMGVAWAVLAAAALALPVWLALVTGATGLRLGAIARPLVSPAIASAVAGVVVLALPSAGWSGVGLVSVAYGLVYGGLTLGLARVLSDSGLAAARQALG